VTELTGWSEYDAAVHVLTAPQLDVRTARFIGERSIAFDELLETSHTWSHGERLLVEAALDLWNGKAHEVNPYFGLRELVDTLDVDNLQRVIDGVLILAKLPVPERV
jgi:hypothetical protein